MVIKLQLGCFDQSIDGWVNADVAPHIWVSRVPCAAKILHRVGVLSDLRLEAHRNGVFRRVKYLNLSRRFHFASDSVDAICSSHVLEHLTRPVAENALRES